MLSSAEENKAMSETVGKMDFFAKAIGIYLRHVEILALGSNHTECENLTMRAIKALERFS